MKKIYQMRKAILDIEININLMLLFIIRRCRSQIHLHNLSTTTSR